MSETHPNFKSDHADSRAKDFAVRPSPYRRRPDAPERDMATTTSPIRTHQGGNAASAAGRHGARHWRETPNNTKTHPTTSNIEQHSSARWELQRASGVHQSREAAAAKVGAGRTDDGRSPRLGGHLRHDSGRPPSGANHMIGVVVFSRGNGNAEVLATAKACQHRRKVQKGRGDAHFPCHGVCACKADRSNASGQYRSGASWHQVADRRRRYCADRVQRVRACVRTAATNKAGSPSVPRFLASVKRMHVRQDALL